MTASHPWIHSTNMLTYIEGIRHATDFPTLPFPTNLPLPSLPSPPRPSEFLPGYALTTHILPAAYPRHSYTEPRRYAETASEIPDDAPPDSAPRAVRQKWANEKNEALVGKRVMLYNMRVGGHLQDGPGADDNSGPALWNVVNRYARVDASKTRDIDRVGLTVLLCHPNGLHKEVHFQSFERLNVGIIELTHPALVDRRGSPQYAISSNSATVPHPKSISTNYGP